MEKVVKEKKPTVIHDKEHLLQNEKEATVSYY